MPALFKTKAQQICNCQSTKSAVAGMPDKSAIILFSVSLSWLWEKCVRKLGGVEQRCESAGDVYRGRRMARKCAVTGYVCLRENRGHRLYRGIKIHTLNVSDQPKWLLGNTTTSSLASGHRLTYAVYTPTRWRNYQGECALSWGRK